MKLSGRTIFVTALLFGSIVLSLGYVSFSQKNVPISLSKISSGVQTCFFRVHQSFTAKLVSQGGSAYLQNDFLTQTEDCFSDVMGFYRKEIEAAVPGVEGVLNELVTEVHWFQEKLQGSGTFATHSTGIDGLSERFSRVENNFDKTLRTLGEYLTARESKTERIRILDFVTTSVAAILFMFLAWKVTSRWRLVERTEATFSAWQKGEKSLIDLSHVLEPLGLAFILRGFSEPDLEAEMMNRESGKVGEHAGNYDTSSERPLATQGTEASEEAIDRIWEMSEKVIEDAVEYTGALDLIEEEKERVNIEETIMNVLDVLSPKIVTCGAVVNLDLDDGLETNVERESLEQAIYHLVDVVLDQEEERNLSLRLVSEESVNSFEFVITGTGLPDYQLVDEQPVPMKIVREILEDMEVGFSIRNMNDAEGAIIGAKFVVSLPVGGNNAVKQDKENGRRLVSVKKGSKKDLMKEMGV